ncbi:MAG: hypothetical protein QNJ88_17565 [Acidimicrobiia bacterium]|nr:hypothetical protein [Acidimicrobiia bacterium]
MIDVVVTTWIGVIGILALGPLVSKLRWGLIGLALPIGAGIVVSVALTMLAIGVPFSVIAVLALATITAGAMSTATVGVRNALLGVRSRWAAVVVAVHLVVGVVVHLVHLTRLTVDSVRYLMTANALQSTGALDAANPWDLRMRHLVAPLLHTGGVVDGAGYSATVTPLFAVSGFVAVGWMAWQFFDRRAVTLRTRWWLLGSMGVLLVTTNRFVYHAFYVNGHMFFAVFALVAIGLAALAAADGDWRLIVPAAVALAAIVPLRPEGLLAVAVLIVPALATHRIPYVQRWLLLIPTIVTAVLWNGVIWPTFAIDGDLGVFGPVYGNLFVAAGLAAGLGLLALPSVQRVGRWGPVAFAGVLAAYLGVSVIAEPDILRASLSAFGANIAVEGLWGTTWWVLALLLGTAWVMTRSVESTLLLVPIPTFLLAVFAFAYLRDGAYRVGTGDSANRMLTHIILVAALAILAAVAESIDKAAAEAAPTESDVAAELPEAA